MHQFANDLDFEEAIKIRNLIRDLEKEWFLLELIVQLFSPCLPRNGGAKGSPRRGRGLL